MAGPSWILVSESTTSDNGRKLSADLDKNIYLSAFRNAATPNPQTALFFKMNRFGMTSWQREIQHTLASSGQVSVVSDGMIFFGGSIIRSGSVSDMLLIKFDPDGNWNWQKVLYSPASETLRQLKVATDGSLLAVGGSDSNRIIKLSGSTGQIVWQRSIKTDTSDYPVDFDIDAGNIFVGGGNTSKGIYLKLNQSGTTTADVFRRIAHSSNTGVVTLDSLVKYGSSIYGVVVRVGSAPALVKFAEDGSAITWQKSTVNLSTFAAYTASSRTVKDGSGNFYSVLAARPTGATYSNTVVIKYNESGSVIWQKMIGSPTDSFSTALNFGASFDSEDGAILLSGNRVASGSAKILLMRLQADGSDVGVFGDFTISDLPVVDTVTTYIMSAQTISAGTNISSVDGSFTITDGTTSLAKTPVLDSLPNRSGGYKGGG